MPVKIDHTGKPVGAPALDEAVKQVEEGPAPGPAPHQITTLHGPGGVDGPASDPAQTAALTISAKNLQADAEAGVVTKDGHVMAHEGKQIGTPWLVPMDYKGPLGSVEYGMEATVNTGNFENVKPYVRITVPFIPGQQDEVYDWAFAWVDQRISGMVNTIKQSMKGA